MSNHAPKSEWLTAFFEEKNNFFKSHNLGPKQISYFKRFLKDADLAQKETLSSFFELISRLGWNTETAQGLILFNLAYENIQVEWYVKNFDIGRVYSRKEVTEMLIECDVKKGDASSIYNAFKRLVKTPLGTVLHWGYALEDGSLARSKCSINDPRVLLYGLFKFAQKCDGHKDFTLSTLLDDSIERAGLSPTRILGLSRREMMPLLLGLSAKHPDFIRAEFTHDLEKIILSKDKSAQDVLNLFEGE
jgi:phosphoadenosine phosphosulfate reductase